MTRKQLPALLKRSVKDLRKIEHKLMKLLDSTESTKYDKAYSHVATSVVDLEYAAQLIKEELRLNH